MKHDPTVKALPAISLVASAMDRAPESPSPDPGTRTAREAALARLLEVLVRLRAPDGCPWDRVQTVSSLGPYLLEEAYETLDAIDRGRPSEVNEELGDCLMNVLMIALAGEAEGSLTVEGVAEGIRGKLVRRHPHVFGETAVSGVGEVWTNWERIKAEEKRARNEDASALAGIPRALPALFLALRTVEKASRAGFRYPDLAGALAKVDEELEELRSEIGTGNRDRQEEELGDLLFAETVLAHHLGLHPETALRKAVDRFAERFRVVERELGASMKDASLERLLAAWKRAKGGSGGEI